MEPRLAVKTECTNGELLCAVHVALYYSVSVGQYSYFHRLDAAVIFIVEPADIFLPRSARDASGGHVVPKTTRHRARKIGSRVEEKKSTTHTYVRVCPAILRIGPSASGFQVCTFDRVSPLEVRKMEARGST